MQRFALSGVLYMVCSVSFGQGFRILPLDIFNNDAQTRQEATGNDLRWTVNMGGCTGSMLSPRYILSAHHCTMSKGATYTSGGCLYLGCKGDLKVISVTEKYAGFDGDIAEVAWSRVDSRWAQRYAPRVQTTAAEITLGRDGSATKLFTVGFPADKSKAMIATGYAKSREGDYLNYNVGIINGNSGGGVWKFDDYTLVSQTNHGPHALNQPGWKNNDPENANAWNGGPQMDRMYAKSPVLKSIFPDGVNYNVSFEGYLIHDDVLPDLDR